jgi:TonB family protein
MLKFPFRLLLCFALAAVPLAASAQTTSTYIRPKVLSHGSNASALAGDGSVTVQVLVKKDGSFSVIKVIKSSNVGNNAAALEIAKSSKFKPATRDDQPVDAYYDYVLNFGGGVVSVDSGGNAGALASIRAGKYDEAKTALQSELQTNPSDTEAYTLLGVADAFSNDAAGAAAAFDKAGTIPDQYKTLAEQSYENAATSLLDAQKYADAITAAGHAIDLNPQSLKGYNVRGLAATGLQNYSAAIADLQKARTIAVALKADQPTMVTIAFNLTVAQLDAGQFGEAATTEKDVARFDGPRSAQLEKFAYVAISNAGIELAKAGKTAESVSRFESGANAFPAQAGALTAQAASVLATDKKPDWDKVKAEAGKALALDPNSGRAQFILGIAAANQKDPKTALDYMKKAKGTSDYGADPALAKQIDNALKQLGGTGNGGSQAGY